VGVAPSEIGRLSAIRRFAGAAELNAYARMMAESEPWITLGRTLEASTANLRDPGKEVYVMEDEGQISRIFQESPNVFMCVSTFNPDARRLYERLGYTAVGELSDYLVPGHGEVLLRKSRGPWSEFR
jgi:[ribosomal protein S18]-alanine N-acetyltransferase